MATQRRLRRHTDGTMDEIVKAALKKWPNVPHCHGWLGLDARGDWYMRDDRTQATGPFPLAKGSRILHDKLRDFIVRNYACDAQGAWFFQNGPQRVYVELEAAPWVWRLAPLRTDGYAVPGVPDVPSVLGAPGATDAPAAPVAPVAPAGHVPRILDHAGGEVGFESAWLDERGRLFLQTTGGFGLVHSLDMDLAAQAVEAGVWVPQEMPFSRMPGRWGYVLSPAAGMNTPAAG